MKVLRDIVAFAVVLASVLLGFAQAFWLMNNQEGNPSNFSKVRSSYYMTLIFMLGQADEEDTHNHARNEMFTKCLVIVFLIVMMLLMLNLLIALMGDSFAKAKDSLHALYRMEVMSIMVDQAGGSMLTRMLGLSRYRPSELVRVLKYTSDLTVEDKSPTTDLEKGVEVTKALLASFPDKFFVKRKKPFRSGLIHDVQAKRNEKPGNGTVANSN